MLLWTLSFICLFVGAREARHLSAPGSLSFSYQKAVRPLREAQAIFHELQERLEAGLAFDEQAWQRVNALGFPWRELAQETLETLRTGGASLVPTLKRLRGLANERLKDLLEARNRSAQALVQAATCAGLVPIFGIALYHLLPGVAENTALWIGACTLALIGVASGALWMLRTADRAQWAGLCASDRPKLLAALCTAEHLLALIRAGQPGDLAWQNALMALEKSERLLAQAWGYSIWNETESESDSTQSAREMILNLGQRLRCTLQVSLMEGKPCSERVEVTIDAFRRDYRAHLERELQLLAQRSLKPLFICVAPSLIFLLAAGFWLTLQTQVFE